MHRVLPVVVAIFTISLVLGAPLVNAAAQTLGLVAGDSVTVNCPTQLTGTSVTTTQVTLVCAANPTSTATATSVPAATPTPTGGPETPVAGRLCPQWVHDRYTTTGPDGKQYPTWHPPVDSQYECFLGHEHGPDPRTSRAANDLPPFGYAAATIGMTEPHAGYKVSILNAGDEVESNIDNKVADEDVRFVFHMGTGGVARYTTEFHSFQLDYADRSGSGRTAHLTGLVDTGTTTRNGSVCDNPRKDAKDFADVTCSLGAYEIWSSTKFQILDPRDQFTGIDQSRFGMTPSFAVFDPITTRDPTDNNRLVYTQDVRRSNGIPGTSPDADFLGCRREFYAGPLYFGNSGRQTVYYTDAYGRVAVNGPDAQHPIRQELSASTGKKDAIWKTKVDSCAPGVQTPN